MRSWNHFNLRCSWSIGCDSYVTKLLPNDLQLQRGIRMQNIWLWIIHSNQLHSMDDHLPKRMGYCRTICHNMCNWNIPDGSAYQWHSSNLPIAKINEIYKFSNFLQSSIFYEYFYLNFSIAFIAWWSQKLLETVFAIQIALLFNKTNILKWSSTGAIYANKMFWTPDATQSSNEWPSLDEQNRKKQWVY